MPKSSDSAMNVPKPTLQRLPAYLKYLRTRSEMDISSTVSATIIANDLMLNEVQVRKDLAFVMKGKGRPKTGYTIDELISGIEIFLGYRNTKSALIAGAGYLGKALLAYKGFANYGLDIITAVETNPDIIGTVVNGKKIIAFSEMSDFCTENDVHIGIIAVPSCNAQTVCDKMIESGILAIWNFSNIHLKVPPNILVQNEDMASSLAVLSTFLDNMTKEN